MADAVVPLRPNRAPVKSRKLPYKGRLAKPFSGVTITVDMPMNLLYIEYSATTDQELIDCGAISAELLAKPRSATKIDEVGNTMHISHRGGVCRVWYWRGLGQRGNLPGLKSWMFGVLYRKIEEEDQERKRRKDEEAAAYAAARGPIYGVLSPDAFRAHLVKYIEDWNFFLQRHIALDPRFVQIENGYQISAEDLRTSQACARSAIDQLIDMARKTRIVRTDASRSGLRLVVDNTR